MLEMIRPETDTNNAEINRRLASVFSEVLNVPAERVRRDLAPVDVDGWDSVGHVMLIAAVEQHFEIQFEVDEIMEFTSFETILTAVEKKLQAA